ncbi:hypothetical protein CNMCM6106_002394 [Aspergillus hiratsukae]|uniref:ferric-chelate reductase (NADPH) n=1 Tax=Aspergillus hiratsukae TaxID=1194566 RepID=A0A8H6UTT0_9EURO|nr:hypothetical protein CNMCM6106_002394 [Aspergillus hiratsukae]
MAGYNSHQPSSLEEKIDRLINDAFDLSLFHMCKVYILVEHGSGVHTFKSSEQRSWPPPDHRLEELYPRLERLYTYHVIRTRLTEDERKDLIQLSLYFLHLRKCLRNPGSLGLDENVRTDVGQIGEHNDAPQDTGAGTMDGGNDDGSDDSQLCPLPTEITINTSFFPVLVAGAELNQTYIVTSRDMITVETIYFLALWAALASLALHRLVRVRIVPSWMTNVISCLGNRSIRHILLSYLVYPRLPVRLLGIDSLSPLQIIFLVLFLTGTTVCNWIEIDTLSQASNRAAQISLALLFPLFLSGGREYPARLLGITLETYGFVHRITGLVSVVEATVHVAIVSRNIKFDSSNPAHFSGLVGGCMLLSLLFVPMVKRRVYEAFLYTHLVFALVGLYAIWKHLPSNSPKLQWCVIACLAACSITTLFQILRIVYRNFVLGRKSVRMTMSPHAEDIMHVTLSLPRSWRVSAGERVCLTVPSVGLFYFFQTHPFTITWWEESEDGNATSISLMFRARTGFTRKLYDRLKPNQKYWALIDGPYGPSLGGKFGISQDLGDYGHILMVTSGIGIAAQLPYAKEILQRRRGAEVRTQRISLVWRLDRAGDWESAREWLQQLVVQDNGYILNVTVYDPLGDNSPQKTHKVGEHELITITHSEVDWAHVLSSEMEKQRGKLLVTVSAQRQYRRTMQQLVSKNVRHNVELFELEFQPWRESGDYWSFFTP